MTYELPTAAWRRPLGLGWDKPYTVRYASNLDDGPWHGAPLGGFGAGCWGRSPRGDVTLWHLDGGEHWYGSIPACQFAVYESGMGAYALSTEAPTDGSLSRWNWYPASTPERSTGEYSALYPRSQFSYQQVFQAEIHCRQFSPILPHDYQATSYPIAIFCWQLHNPSDRPLTISLLLSWENLCGWFTNTNKAPEVVYRDDGSPVYDYVPAWGQSEGNLNQRIQGEGWQGLLLDQTRSQTPDEGDGQWAIAVAEAEGLEIFRCDRWNPTGDGSELWQTFAADGSIPDRQDSSSAAAGERLAGAIAVRLTLQPGESREIPFSIAWDLPVTEFAAGVKSFRRYTDFFGREGCNAAAIAATGLQHYAEWETAIEAWQQPILDRTDLSDTFKLGLFNELYDLCSGGSLWTAASEADPVGQFAVLECLDYAWYESLDVRLYGAFGLLMLWPELEKAVMRAFARAIPQADDRTRVIGYWFTIGQESPLAKRKLANATPHDLGAPNESPWLQTNYTGYQDCNLWKDLGCDFVLQVWRDYQLTGASDRQFLLDCWPAAVAALRYLKDFDLDGDGIPENSGAPDQTFDDWRLQGISAYCGGLWIAALEAALAIADVLALPRDDRDRQDFQTWLTQARSLYHDTLWNGRYYRLDSGSGSEIVMADQLCGDFYSRLLKLPPVAPIEAAQSTADVVYEACFQKFHSGQFGLANGLLPDGSPVDPKGTHPLEVWTGINFGIAAYWLLLGYRDRCFEVAETVVRQIYENGLQFRTPEAITANDTFRASHYLRPLAIWGIYGVLTDFAPVGLNSNKS
ncbi:GH116 family glycosyl hydrolase [Synechococcus elongatus]|uniref:GH116 family glycosyl hydrolase n=1 Tax=Synechococcus elongatus TaxID=32046 RepID=UPI0030D060C7